MSGLHPKESRVSLKKTTTPNHLTSFFFPAPPPPLHTISRKKFLLDEKSCWCQKMLFITCHQDGDTKAQVAASAVAEELLLLRWQHGTYKKVPLEFSQFDEIFLKCEKPESEHLV